MYVWDSVWSGEGVTIQNNNNNKKMNPYETYIHTDTHRHRFFIWKYKWIKRQHFASILQQYCKGQRQLRDMLLGIYKLWLVILLRRDTMNKKEFIGRSFLKWSLHISLLLLQEFRRCWSGSPAHVWQLNHYIIEFHNHSNNQSKCFPLLLFFSLLLIVTVYFT